MLYSPFCKNVASRVGKETFPRYCGQKLHSRPSIQQSFQQEDTKSILLLYVKYKTTEEKKKCMFDCRNQEFPVNGKSLTESFIYIATVKI